MTTQRFALLGHPVSHSVSPAIHAAAYEQLQLDARYELIDCADQAAVETQLRRLRQGELSGANVTVPHKQLAIRLADEVDPLAARAGAANVLAPSAGRIKAHNTDVLALVEELSVVQERATALVIGSGGAARAAVVACRELGLTTSVTARRFTPPQLPSEKFAQEVRALGADVLPWPGADTDDSWRRACRLTDVLIQTTSAGMIGAAPGHAVADRVPWPELPQHCLAYDVVYNPTCTPFLERARARGLRAMGGLGMLVGQAAHAIRIWSGQHPARQPMLNAAEVAMGLRA